MQKIILKINNEETCYFLTKKRNIKNVNMRIKEDLNIYVSAPYGVRVEFINEFIKAKIDWIKEAKARIEERKLLKIEAEKENKNVFCFLGNKYEIRFNKANKNLIRLGEGYIEVFGLNEERVEKLLDEFLKKKALELIYEMLEEKREVLAYVGLKAYPEIKLRKMKSRWGSCHYTANKIVLNTHLFSKPIICVEYVLLHEICHFKVPNHSKEFHDTLSKFMPEWRKVKKLLNK